MVSSDAFTASIYIEGPDFWSRASVRIDDSQANKKLVVAGHGGILKDVAM